MRGKKIFVSGGAGVVGTALVNKLLDAGAELFVGDLKPQPHAWEGRIQYRKGDLNYLGSSELAEFKPEFFFHLAATFERTEENSSFFSENFHHNIKLSHHLLSIMKQFSSLKRVIFASSYLIYNSAYYLFEFPQNKAKSLKESDEASPRNLCGAAKLYHEAELAFTAQSNQVTFAAARIFRVYGKGSRDVISRWVRAALSKETIQVYRPEGLFDYINAEDVAEGLIRLANSHWQGVVNLGSGRARSVQNILDVLMAHFPNLSWQKQTSEIWYEASQADMQLFRELTNWNPQYSLETAIPEIIGFEENREICPQVEGNTLITSLAGKIPLIQAIRKAAAKAGVPGAIIGCDMDSNCKGRYLVDQFWQSPPVADQNVEKFLEYCQQHKITIIIPTRDGDLEFFSKHLKAFQYIGVQVMVSSAESVQLCSDKLAFYEHLQKTGFPAIPTTNKLPQQEGLYVVKEQYGSGSIGVAVKLTRAEVHLYAQKLKHPIFQPYIEGKEWSVDLYVDRHNKVKGCVARTRDLVLQGESHVTTTALFPELETLCQALAEELKINGHAVIQVMQDPEGLFHIIECNPRFGGASTASLAVGLDSFYWFFLEAAQQDLSQYPFLRKPDVRQLRVAQELILPLL